MRARLSSTNLLLPGLLALLSLLAAPSHAAYEDVVLTEIASGLSGPTALVSPEDGSGRLFVIQNTSGQGRLRIINADGNLLPTPYWSHAITGGPDSEQGMLGLAFAPDFAVSGVLYVTYTAPGSDPRLGAQPDQVLAQLVANDPDANVFSGTVNDVLRLPDPYWNHNGGNIAFGPDGYLYWGMGDGGSGGDPNNFSQELWKKLVSGNTYYLLGKMLRLDVHTDLRAVAANQCGAGSASTARYSIPADNPYAGAADKCGEIWLYGLRNPWRWSFDRLTGDLIIGDVGQNAWEEVNFRAFASTGNNNYGWRRCEGNHYFNPSGSGTDCPATTGTVAPVIEYSHAYGYSITGGYVYRGPIASLQGKYLFSDAVSGKIWIATVDSGPIPWPAVEMLAGTPSLSTYSFGEDEIGNVYVLSASGGKVYRIDSTATPTTWTVTPLAGPHGLLDPPTPQTVDDGDSQEFQVNPDPGYAIDEVTGCGGTLVGNTYTTAPVHADCTVRASFLELPERLFRDGFED